ncbi:kinase-like domain-containing protein [Gigaspora margarita]|uniref:Kinase-like domain-containing protein n=1 Tax=Gigaspora margarita TaxID=4874 RepID=A0A8H4ELT7_GIGMA|nr:kinase-like domain-containing protein [Gigaspora margarita]
MERNSHEIIIKSTHENLEIDNVVKKLLEDNRYQLTWFPYNEFKNIKEIGQGYFATVYSADWIKKTTKYSTIVTFALKKIHDQNYLDELKAYCEIGYENPTFLKCHESWFYCENGMER